MLSIERANIYTSKQYKGNIKKVPDNGISLEFREMRKRQSKSHGSRTNVTATGNHVLLVAFIIFKLFYTYLKLIWQTSFRFTRLSFSISRLQRLNEKIDAI